MIKKSKPEWEEKCWGRVQHIFTNPYTAVSKLEVEAGWMCSRHFHRQRFNMFSVTSGAIVVEEWKGRNHAKTLLCAGDVLVVPPDVLHRFRVVEKGSIVEVYWPKNHKHSCDSNDIERLDVGRLDPNAAELLQWVEQNIKEEQ